MSERTTLEIIAPTVEEAIAQGLAQLGLTADAVSIEVLDTGNRGLFGLGRPQGRVRLTVVPPAGTDNPPAGGVKETRTDSSVPSTRSASQSKGAPEAKSAIAPTQSPSPRVQDEPLAEAGQDAPVISSSSGKSAEAQLEHDPVLDRAEAVVSKLLHMLNLEAQVSAHYGAAEHDD